MRSFLHEVENLSSSDATQLANSCSESCFLQAIRGLSVPRPPVWFLRQAGRYQAWYQKLRQQYSFLQCCLLPEIAAHITVQAVEDTGADAAIIFSDILLIVQAFGQELRFEAGQGPRVASGHPNVEAHLGDFDVNCLQSVYQAITLARGQLSVPLIGFVGGPFTVASYIIEGGPSTNFANTKRFMFCQPKAWRRLLEQLTGGLAEHLRRQVASGAQVMQVFDSWVGCLTPADYASYVLPYTRQLIQAQNQVPTIHYARAQASLLPLIAQAEPTVVGLDHLVSLAQARALLGSTAIQGNLDPAVLLGPPSLVEDKVGEILRENNQQPGFIFNVGQGILPCTPIENVRLACQIVHRYVA